MKDRMIPASTVAGHMCRAMSAAMQNADIDTLVELVDGAVTMGLIERCGTDASGGRAFRWVGEPAPALATLH